MKKINVLPQTFYKFKCDKSIINKILPHVEEEKYVAISSSPTDNSKSINTFLHKEERYKELINWIYKCINEFKEDLQLQCEKFTITQCWLNSTMYGQSHHPHLHPNSFLSGVLYLNNSDVKTLFVGDSSWIFFNDKNKILQVAPLKNPGLSIIHEEDSVECTLILFPSNIVHQTSPSCSFSNTRYTLSFNAFPSGKIGNIDFLSSLEIEIK